MCGTTELLILDIFASTATAVNQIICYITKTMQTSHRFFAQSGKKNTAVQFSGLSIGQ